MNTKITLTNLTDDELSGAVAEHVDGWRYIGLASTVGCDPRMWAKGTPWQADYVTMRQDQFNYATSADAVLPLLEKAGRWSLAYNLPLSIGGYSVMVSDACWVAWWAEDPTFPRAACIALLRANGVEVIT